MSWTHSWPSGLQRAWTAPPLWLFIICTTPCWSHWIRPALPLTCCCPSSHLCSDLSNMLGSSALFHLHQWPPGLYTRTPNLTHDAKPQDARLLCFWSFHCSRGFISVNGLLRARARPRPAALHDHFSFAASTWPKPAPRVSAITQYQVQLPAWEAALDLCGLLVLTLRRLWRFHLSDANLLLIKANSSAHLTQKLEIFNQNILDK